jgi:hypothetical protein
MTVCILSVKLEILVVIAVAIITVTTTGATPIHADKVKDYCQPEIGGGTTCVHQSNQDTKENTIEHYSSTKKWCEGIASEDIMCRKP